MRDRINAAMKDALKSGEKRRLSTLRLMTAAIKDRDIAARGKGNNDGISARASTRRATRPGATRSTTPRSSPCCRR